MTASVSDVSTEATVSAIVAAHHGRRGPLLAILHAVQEELGHIPEEAIGRLAGELNLSRADVHGVVSFYHDFRREPAGRTTVRICRAEACQAVGADALVARVRERLGVAPGDTTADTTPDGSVTVEQVFCLGNCALGPAVQIDGRVHGRMTADRLHTLLDEAVSS
ncbi:formate dehydrogenase subunit gamma [Streptomyces sp. Ru73]|uniref:formate dehydrogenase subunit gamma n=1 Tax=Streptomyces sp. Ru73 TaxID=2080748 RepID=UPI000CDE3C14|nr:formate dehydrogenase subunit gamma [Streptomyces sp. Ru73]POX38853.1 formate dehydrogenase subunit gamma [Streptomyces sp. Ru73]